MFGLRGGEVKSFPSFAGESSTKEPKQVWCSRLI